MWRLAERWKSFETCNNFEGQPCMIAESLWNGTFRLDDTRAWLSVMDGKLFIYHHQKPWILKYIGGELND